MLSLKIRYRKNAKPTVINLDVSGNTTIEEIAEQAANKLAKGFKRYATGISERSLEKYRFAQYMMLKLKLSEMIK
ncbi:MAG: hypothetical protein WA102_06830 [Candidatus Methanoperedens sp.]